MKNSLPKLSRTNRLLRYGLTLAALGLCFVCLPATLSAQQAPVEISGRWEWQPFGIAEIRRDGQKITADWVELQPVPIEDYGFKVGDWAFEGTLDGLTLSGMLHVHAPLSAKATCPAQWDAQTKFNVTLSTDGNTLEGKWNRSSNTSDCTTKPPVLVDMVLHRVKFPKVITGGITDLNALFGPPHSSRLSTIEFPPQEKVWLSLKPRLTGNWTDKEDRNYSLIQSDWSDDTSNKQSNIFRGADRATLKLYTSEGGQFSGEGKVVLEFTTPEIKPPRVKLIESSIELEYQLQEGTVESRFPDWLKEMIVKQEVLGRMRLKGTLSPDFRTISASYVDYDIEADPDTRTITKRKERLTPLVLTFQHAPCGPNEILAERERESKELGEFQSRLEKVQLSWEEKSLQASIISLSSIFETDFDAINKARKLYNEDLQPWRKMEIDVVDKELPKNWSPYYGRRYGVLMTDYRKLEAVIEKSEPWRKKLAPLIIKFGDLITDRLKDANTWRLSKRPAYYCITQDRILGPEAENEYRKKYRSLFPVSDGLQYQARYELIVPPKPQLLPEDIPQGHTARPPIRHDLWSEAEVKELERAIESGERAQEDMKFFVEHTELFGVIAEKLNELLKKH